MSNAAAVEALFFGALEKGTPAEQAAYLDSACGDAELRRQVEKLLKAHPRVGDFIEKPVIEQLASELQPSHGTQELDNSTEDQDSGPDGRERSPRTGAGRPLPDDAGALAFLEPAARPDSLGRLGHYEILEVLGRGGFGIVFRADDEVLQREVALKVLAPQMAVTSPARKRFLREARSSARVRHENIVQVHTVEEKPLPYLVMEYIPGETLQQRIARTGPLPTLEVVQMGIQLAEGLAAAHAAGLIHRDIKPGNILLEGVRAEGSGLRNKTEDSASVLSPDPSPLTPVRVKITDFGLARTADDASQSQSGLVAGTPMFMAPEQARAEHIDYRADLFSLGSVLYTMTTGRPPFRAKTALAVLKRVAEDTPRPIPEIIPEAPAWLCEIIAKLHAKRPEDRFASAKEVADLLKRHLDGLQHPEQVMAAPPAGLPTVALPAPESPEPAPVIRRRPLPARHWAVAAALLLMLLGGLGITDATGVTDFHGKVIRLLSQEAALVVEVEAGPGDEVERVGPVVPPPDPKAVRKAAELAWERGVAALTAEEQAKAVAARLKELNPGFGGEVVPVIIGGVVTGLQFRTDEVDNIGPVRALKGLTSLDCRGTYPRKGKLSDLWPLQGMSLHWLECSDTKVSTLNALKGIPLKSLFCNFTDVSDLAPLKGMALEELGCAITKVSDLSPLKGMKLQRLEAMGIAVPDLTPLQGMPLRLLDLHRAAGVTNLQPLQGMPLEHLNLSSLRVSDLSILKGMTTLQTLVIEDTLVSDLTPLRGLMLTHLGMKNTKATDLSVLRSLRRLEQINDLTPEEFWKDADRKANVSSRRAAEYALSIGGGIKINGGGREIRTVAGLPAGAFRLTHLWLFGNRQLNDAGLANFEGCTDLREINLSNGKNFSDVGVAHLRGCKNLEGLHLAHTQVTNAGLAHFAACKNLTTLDLSASRVTDAGLMHFEGCTKLVSLQLYFTRGVTGKGLAAFKGSKTLTFVNLYGTPVTASGLAHLEDCTELTHLDLGGTKVTNDGLAHFKGCKNLTTLKLANAQVTEAGLAHLAGCKKLATLLVKGTKVSAAGIEELKRTFPMCRIEWNGGVILPQ